MKKLAAAFNAVHKGFSRPMILSFFVIFFLFGGIVFNFFIEGKVHDSVKRQSEGNTKIVKQEQYKQLVDKTSFLLSEIDNELSKYLLTGNEEKLNQLNQKMDGLQQNMMLVREQSEAHVPKYLVNLFLHKVRNRILYQNQVIAAYHQKGKDGALILLNNEEYRKTYTEYAASETELTAALNKKTAQLSNMQLADEAYTLQLDNRWNIISFVFMLLIAVLVLYQTARIGILNKELGVAVKKMKHATQVKDQFMSNITHELRTPLNSILGYTNLLLKRHHDPETEKWIQAVNSSGVVLLDIVNDVLDYSKLESGYLHTSNEPFELDEVLSNLKNIMSNRAETKALSLVILKDNSLPASFKGDEKKLKQILINLTGNAVKFTEKGTVKVEVLLNRKFENQYWLEFIVSDTGIGISPVNLPHIFDRFYQVEDRYSRKYSGTGLGLPIVKQLVDMQGGTITVKSNLASGTCFRIMMPFEIAETTVNDKNVNLAPVHSMLKAAKKKILVVDDHELNRELLVLLLKQYNCQVITASNGNEAITILNHKRFDLVLMDVQMPELNGIETTQIIRNQLALELPIIACTAFSQPSEKKACEEAGMNDYLGKPVEETELLRLLSKYLHLKPVQETGQALVNFSQINGITGANKEITGVMISRAIEMIPQELENLHQSILHYDYAKMKELSHNMCSTLGLMGAPAELTVQVKKIQYAQMKEEGEHEKILHLFYEINDTVKKMIVELKNYLAA
jgi:signal transduction histidine kinase/CheY-like chemotaxis protein